MNKTFAAAATIAAGSAIGLALAPAAQADDYMYRVGSDIQPGDYTYRIVGGDWGSWLTCSNATCDVGNGLIDIDVIDGTGHTGYLTIPQTAKFVKVTNLQLTPS
jgi:hypothetical protein